MKKPDYIKIEFTAKQKDFKSAVLKYFTDLEGTTAEIRFSELRDRKVFCYKIEKVKNNCYLYVNENKQICSFMLKLRKEE